METLRTAIRDQLRALVGSSSGRAASPPGDGLFAPDAVARKVHGDFTTMMVGGVSALLLQMLHPGALAGVWDHSHFRKDMQGRLRRTAQFMSVTTYGGRAQALDMVDRVRTIHSHVHGILPDGRPYRADDPHLLTWVHVAGESMFLEAYRRYRDPLLSGAARDRYFAETAEVARLLGADDVPQSAREAAEFLHDIRPELVADSRTREVVRFVLERPADSLTLAPFQRLVLDAGVDLLPDWAARMHGLSMPAIKKPAVRAATAGVQKVLRWALH